MVRLTTIKKGSSGRLTVHIYDFDQTTLIDPDSQTIKLIDPNGQQVSSNLTPTKSDTGIYYVTIEIGAEGTTGTWTVDWTATYESFTSREEFEFEVEQ